MIARGQVTVKSESGRRRLHEFVNKILGVIERHRQNRLLTELLDSIDAEYGAVDEGLVEKYAEMLEPRSS